MKIIVIGVGYVGLVTAACLADLGNDVVGIDIDKKKITRLKKGIIPIYEPGLDEIVKKNIHAKRITFDINLKKHIKTSQIIFIAVGTPPKEDGQADLRYVLSAAENIAKAMNNYKIIINKSTVPIGTGQMVANTIKKFYKGDFDVVSNPEFLREGTAVSDFMKPDRIVVGHASQKAKNILEKLYSPLGAPILYTNIETAEMIKYASNSMLATQISFINSIANICERLGANVEDVAQGMRLDKRIGKNAFLSAGAGYGGSCFPKDVKALIQIAKRHDYDFSILKKVEEVNHFQREIVADKVAKMLGGKSKNKIVAVWGLAFKPETDDMREAPSIDVIKQLQAEGIKIHAYDPIAQKNAQMYLKNIKYFKDIFGAAKNASLLLILTGWNEFFEVDKAKLKKVLGDPRVLDARNIYDPTEMKKLGFIYESIGR